MNRLSPAAKFLITQFNKTDSPSEDKKITVNPLVAEVAAWYEKLRNAMDYREEEVILRAAVERIIKRRLLLGDKGEKIAKALVKELVWARYFPDNSIPEAIVDRIESRVNLYTELEKRVGQYHKPNKDQIWSWLVEVMSSDITAILHPNDKTEMICNYMFYIFKDRVGVEGLDKETSDIQVFIAIRKALAKEDPAMLRYDLFCQFFGYLEENNLEGIAKQFAVGYQEIENHLKNPVKDKIFAFIKKQTVPFVILKELLHGYKNKVWEVAEDEEQLDAAIARICSDRYQDIRTKVKRAITRSIFFLLLTKAVMALLIEGTYESIVFGKVLWGSIAVNTAIPPMLMFAAGLFIKTPGKDNTAKINEKIKLVLFDPASSKIDSLTIKKDADENSAIYVVFGALWMLACLISFGAVIFTLNMLHFNLVSQGVFCFFLAIVSFLSYRINQTANIYTLSQDKQTIGSILFDFFLMPFVQVGRHLTLGVSKINFFLIFFDLMIEAPFKGLFGFSEHWFLFLRTQREEMD